MIDGELDQSARSPARAALLQSPGRKPWVSHSYTSIEPQRGGTFPTNAKPQTATTQNKCSRRKCRSYGALIFCVRVYPGLHFGLCPHYTLGFEEVSCLRHSRQHQTTNPTTSANNDTNQQTQQQAQTTIPPNKSDNRRKQRHPTNPTTDANNDTEQ